MEKNKTFNNIKNAKSEGRLHILYGHLTEGFRNVKVPYVSDKDPNHEEKELWIISDPRDCEKICRNNLKKMPNLKEKVLDSIISTTDVEHWKDQRSDYVEAFIPNTVFPEIIPKVIERAIKCVEILRLRVEMPNISENLVDMSEFLLGETQAQLQLNMFGFSEAFEIETNKKVREAFNSEDKRYLSFWAKKASTEGNGPLGEIFKEREPWTNTENIGNAITFSFAGHDTTGHTLAWLLYEIACQPATQKKLQEEVDLFWKNHDNIEIDYFYELKYMTRCITEILRMWPANSNGTFRELEQPETIFINDTQQIELPIGTYCQIPNWSRHRSKKLWGNDVNMFNPEREFKPEEIWEDQGYSYKNPYSDRFSPFTYPPRDCIGKNFSHLEMRVILLYLIKNFYFEPKYLNMEGLNHATMGPRDPTDPDKIGMPLIVKFR